MEIRPTMIRLEAGTWVCRCDAAEGFGETPEDAYVAWLGRFQYRGPDLPINFSYGGVDSRETDRRT